MNVPMGPALNLAASQFSDGETIFSLMLSCRVTPNLGTRHGSTVRILLRLMRTRCPAFALCALSPTIYCRTSYLPLNAYRLLLP